MATAQWSLVGNKTGFFDSCSHCENKKSIKPSSSVIISIFSKKNSLNRPHGFDDPTQGTLFFHIKEIIRRVKPKAILLENVKHLKNHDRGRTFSTINQTLDECGYNISHRVVDAKGWVPQHRERIYIVGFRKKQGGQKWSIDDFGRVLAGIKFSGKPKKLSYILQKNVSAQKPVRWKD